jgi:hypothetical protein
MHSVPMLRVYIIAQPAEYSYPGRSPPRGREQRMSGAFTDEAYLNTSIGYGNYNAG